jgi:deoxycytidine triphosphate deaminase
MIMSDRWITRMARETGMIEPFEDRQVRKGVISYGVSSYGYDMRVAREFRIFTNVMSSIVDPKAFDPKSFVEYEGDTCIVPPNSFALARSVEYFRIPRNVLTVTVGKSTYARCGIITNVTPVRAGVGGLRHPRNLEHDGRCRRASTPTKGSPRSSSSAARKSRKCRTRTRAGNIRARSA